MNEVTGGREQAQNKCRHVQDPVRLSKLNRTGLLDSEAEEAFDRWTRLASNILGVPVAIVSLVDKDRQFFKSQIGLTEPWASDRQTPLSHSFCRHVVEAKEPLVVVDARVHPLVHENLAVRDLGVVAYAGIPLTTSDGQALGAFCAIDDHPREWTRTELDILKDLTAAAMTEIELRLTAQDAKRQAENAERERNQRDALLSSNPLGIYGLDLDGRCSFINHAAAQLLGESPEKLQGTDLRWPLHHTRSIDPSSAAKDSKVWELPEADRVVKGEDEIIRPSDGTCIPVEYSAAPLIERGVFAGTVITTRDITSQKQTSQRLSVQYAVSDILTSATRFQAAGPQLLRSLGEVLNCQFGAVWHVDDAAGVLRCTTTWKNSAVDPNYEVATRELTFAKGEGLPGRVWQTREPVIADDILDDCDFQRRKLASDNELDGALFFPLQTGFEVFGVIELFSHRLPAADDKFLRTVKTAGYQIGQFIRRERAQDELRNSEALKTAVIESAMDCVILMDDQGNVLEWNPAAEKTFGYRRDDVLGREMADLIIPPSLQESHRRGLQHYIATGEGAVIGRRIEISGMRADRSTFPIELTVTPVVQEESIAFTGYVRDITDRKHEEKRQLEQMRIAALTTDVGLAITQSTDVAKMLQSCADALVRHLSGAFARVWLLNEQDQNLELRASAGIYTHLDGAHSRIPIGQFKIGMIAQERKPHLTNSVVGDPRVNDQEWAKREGMVSFAGYPLIVGNHVLGVMGMFAREPLSDATLQAMSAVSNGIALGVQRIRAEEQLTKSKIAAEDANQAKSQFLANMSHELRTPLNAVILYSELLIEEAEDQQIDGFIPDLEKIRNAGKHLLGLINDVLDLSKIEAGKMDAFVESFDIQSMIAEVCTTVRPLVEKKKNQLTVDCPRDMGEMTSDLTKVRQILFNLLSNASKFTEGGTITLTICREAEPDQTWITFSVVDSGIGMSEAQQKNLFQPFTQADPSTTRKYGGTGLGLVITRRLCEMLNGTIEVGSVLEKGSTFTVRLPLHESVDSVPEPIPTSHNAGEPGTGTVLVIDDDPATLEMMSRLLRKEGYRSVLTSGGEEGLRLAREVRPDVITLDVKMPRLDGWAVLNALKSDPSLSAIPVILVTMVDDRNLGYWLGASEHLLKPIDRRRLSSLLKKYIQDTSRRILVVDDDEGTRRMLREAVAALNCEVMEAQNGLVALERVKQARPDLIILDLLMPEMDGFKFAAELRRNENWRTIPVVVLTAKDLSPEDGRQLEGCVEKIVAKGTGTREELLAELHRLIRTEVPPPGNRVSKASRVT